jgi:purine-cytosine permease-like protein
MTIMRFNERGVSWLHRVGPFAAIGTTPAALMLGGGLAEQVPGPSLHASILIGALLVLILTTLNGIRGQQSRKVFYEVAVEALGPRASRLGSLLMAALMTGWYAFAVGVGGTALANMLSIPPLLGVLIYSGTAAALARMGLRRWNWVALASILATVAFLLWSSWVLGPSPEARDIIGAPLPGSSVLGASMLLGFAAAFALRAPDFTRDMRSRGDVLKASLLGLSLPLSIFALFGSMLYAAYGTWDLPLLLGLAGFPSLANLFLVVGFLASSLANLFSAQLSARHLTGLGDVPSFLTVLSMGTFVAALGFYHVMVLWLVLLGISVPPLIVTLVVGRTARQVAISAGLVAWGLGTLAGLIGWLLGFDLYLFPGLLVPLAVLIPWRERTRRSLQRNA